MHPPRRPDASSEDQTDARIAREYVARAFASALAADTPERRHELGDSSPLAAPQPAHAHEDRSGRSTPSSTCPFSWTATHMQTHGRLHHVEALMSDAEAAAIADSRISRADSLGSNALNLEIGSARGSLFSYRSSSGAFDGITAVVPQVLYIGAYRDVCTTFFDEPALLDAAYLCVAKEVSHPFPAVRTGDDDGVGSSDASPLSLGGENPSRAPTLHIPVTDSSDTLLSQFVDESLQFIDRQRAAGRPTIVYCQAGKSRSAAVAVAFLMREHQLSAADGLRWLQTVYPRAEPNIYFLQQLAAREHQFQHGPRAGSAHVPPANLAAALPDASESNPAPVRRLLLSPSSSSSGKLTPSGSQLLASCVPAADDAPLMAPESPVAAAHTNRTRPPSPSYAQ